MINRGVTKISKKDMDRHAAAGMLVSEELGMSDSSPADVLARVKSMAMSLRIISTWAACDSGSRECRLTAMKAIEKRAHEGLGIA